MDNPERMFLIAQSAVAFVAPDHPNAHTVDVIVSDDGAEALAQMSCGICVRLYLFAEGVTPEEWIADSFEEPGLFEERKRWEEDRRLK